MTETKIVVLLLLGVLKLLCGLAPLVLAPVLKRRNNGWHVKKFIGEPKQMFIAKLRLVLIQ